jgi:hypothetical protein
VTAIDDMQSNLSMPDEMPELSTELITLAQAAKISGLSHSHLRLLIRQGVIEGKKIGWSWLTTEAAIRGYLETKRRPGPKSLSSSPPNKITR